MQLHSKRKLNNGLLLPWLGFGVYKVSNADIVKSINWALEAGLRHIDTASVYGNEAGVGKAIKQSRIKREELFITTKLWNEDMRAGRQKDAFERSLDELELEQVDLYLIHWPVENFRESWKILESIYASRRARAIGVSNFQIPHLEALLERSEVVPAVNQIETHPYLTQYPLIEFCARRNIVCEAWGPLGGEGAPVLKDPVITRLAETYGKTPAQIILRWNLQRNVVPLVKSVHKDRIVENTRLFDFELSDKDIKAIDALNQDRRLGPDPDNFDF